MKQIYTNF